MINSTLGNKVGGSIENAIVNHESLLIGKSLELNNITIKTTA